MLRKSEDYGSNRISKYLGKLPPLRNASFGLYSDRKMSKDSVSTERDWGGFLNDNLSDEAKPIAMTTKLRPIRQNSQKH